MKKFPIKTTLASLLLATLLPACQAGEAGETDIRAAVVRSFPGTEVKSVEKSPVPGLYELVVDGPQGPAVLYADDKGEFLVIGEILKLAEKRNLTRERMDKLLEIDWSSLPLDNAIKIVQGNGSRKMAVFSDPDCPYCRKAEAEFSKLKDVTLYIFPYPLPMHPDAGRKSALVWCGKDRAQAWRDLMLKNELPAGKADCKNPIEDNLALGAKLRIDGTPAMIFPNGKRVPGYADAARLEAMLANSQ